VRGTRGGFATRGGPRGGRKAPNGTSHDAFEAEESLDDQGELGEMKKKYSSELSMLKDMFPDWTDVDLVLALDEANGDLPSTVELITEGGVTQFAEVKKPKDRARSKVADGFSTAGATDKPAFAARGGRGRGGIDSTRGGRGGRGGSDRARGGFRGGRGGHATTNGAPKEANATSVPTTESSAWDIPAAATETGTSAWDNTAPEASKDVSAGTGAWGNVAATEAAPVSTEPTMLPAKETAERAVAAPEISKATAAAADAGPGPKKSWASMFAQPKPPVALPKSVPQAPKAPEPVVESTPAVETPAVEQEPAEEVKEPESIASKVADAAASILPESVLSAVGLEGHKKAAAEPAVATPITESAPELDVQTPQSATAGQEALPPTSHEPLTQENVEHLPDDSHPPTTLTAASTVGSADPRNLTPVPGQQQPPIGRPPVGGFAISAHRAAATSGRSASFQRRVQEQQEAVVMPGHNAVDRAAVQFGSMGLNGEPGLDVDEEREEPETRQAPQHSPPTQPKASLPAAPRQAATQEPSAPEALPTPKQAPGLGPASQQNQPQAQESVLGQSIPQEPTHLNQGQNQNYNQYAAYGQGAQQDTSAQQQKMYDPFGHQAQSQGRYDQYGTQPQSSHSGFGALSSAPNDYSSYYTADPQRNAYSGYYGTSAGYAPQAQQQQDAGLSQQRSASGFGASNESAFGAQTQQQVGLPLPKVKRRGIRKKHPQSSDHGSKTWTMRDLDDLSSSLNLHSYQISLSNQSKQTQSRYGEAPGSGHNTPNPIAASQHQNAQSAPQSQQHPMHQAPSHHQQQQQQQQAQAQAQAAYNAGFPYGHPYYNSPYQQAYQNQFGYTQPASGYGGYQGKQQGGMYGAPYSSTYEQQSASPANAGAFSQNQQTSMRSASGMGTQLGGGLDDYGRSAAQQTSSLNQSSGFGGVDPFARTTSGFGQNSYAQQPGMTATSQEDALKPFSESKTGPSPSLGQPGRPGSAANSVVGSQTSVPQQQQQQQSAFGGYGGFPSQGNQYGGLGGLGGQQQQPQQQQQQQQQQQGMGGQGGYGSYGASAFGQYGGYGSQRGGWGQSYGAH
jgi:hypothetical protein